MCFVSEKALPRSLWKRKPEKIFGMLNLKKKKKGSVVIWNRFMARTFLRVIRLDESSTRRRLPDCKDCWRKERFCSEGSKMRTRWKETVCFSYAVCSRVWISSLLLRPSSSWRFCFCLFFFLSSSLTFWKSGTRNRFVAVDEIRSVWAAFAADWVARRCCGGGLCSATRHSAGAARVFARRAAFEAAVQRDAKRFGQRQRRGADDLCQSSASLWRSWSERSGELSWKTNFRRSFWRACHHLFHLEQLARSRRAQICLSALFGALHPNRRVADLERIMKKELNGYF